VLAGTRAAILRAEQSPLLPADQRAVIPDLLRLIDNMPSFEDLPCGIIHTDPYLVNLIETPSGSLALIDWEDAGISYPLLDVAYGAAHLCTFTARDRRMWGVPGPDEGLLWRPDWGKIFLTAYEAVRPLTPAERNLLPDAVRFSFLCYIPMWGVDEIILENYQRMQMVAPG
jgi:Ser/Thr protein kinase RdoA (MazF antagonist)